MHTTIGSGGGSIAHLDASGGLRVGPQSAGSEPGPASYGNGGEEATVTVENKTLIVTPGPRRARGGWAEALRSIPQRELDRDFAALQSFREAPDEWEAIEWQWPESDADEKV